MHFNHFIKHIFKSKSSKSRFQKRSPKMYEVKLPSLNNTLVFGMTSASLGIMSLRRFLGEHIPRSAQANQDDVNALIYFERKEGKQMLADGFKFHDLHPAMQAALKYGKAYLDKQNK